MSKFFKRLISVGCLATLAACGSGGSDGGHKEELNQTFPLSVQVSGLTKHGLILQNKGSDDLVIAVDGVHNFSKPVSYKENYVITVKTQPVDEVCTVKNGSGIAVSAIASISVICSALEKTYTIGGVVTGLNPDEKVTLLNNDGDQLVIDANKSFTFVTPVAFNSGYKVTVATQPESQICTVTKGTGSGVNADITNIKVICSTKTYSVGGSITGLNTDGLVILLNNSDDHLILETNDTFTFATPIAHGSDYEVTVAAQPKGQICTVPNGKGYFVTADITNITVLCSAKTFTIGGSVTGLDPGDQVTLANNFDVLNDSKTIYANEPSFIFNTPVVYDSGYLVTVATQPLDKTCTVANGTGKGVNADVTNIAVICSKKTYSIGGSITGLNSGELVILLNNSDDPLTIDAGKSSFVFDKRIAHGSGYRVTVTKQPVGQTCTVNNGERQLVDHDITDIVVTCSSLTYTVGGSVTGLNPGEQVTLANNGDIDNDALTIKANEKFTFNTPVVHGRSYAVAVTTQPVGQLCEVRQGTGENISGNITSVIVECSTKMYTLGGNVIGLKSGNQVTLFNKFTNGVDWKITTNGPFSFVKRLPYNSNYEVTLADQPADQLCKVVNGAGEKVTADITNITVECSTKMHTVGGTITGLKTGKITLNNHGDDVELTAHGQDIPFEFSVAHGHSYAINVVAKPDDHTCTVSKGTGDVTGDVNDVSVTCSTITFNVGGTVTGLKPGHSLVLYNHGVRLVVDGNSGGQFNFSNVAYNSDYDVTVGKGEDEQPVGQTCSVDKGSGKNITKDVRDIAVTCSDKSYVISVNLTGLDSGKSIKLKNNDEELPALSANGTFSFTKKVAHGGRYTLTIASSPFLQHCQISGDTGSPVKDTTVNVACGAPVLTTLVDFNGANGGMPFGTKPFDKLIQARDGHFYGVAKQGKKQRGTIFRMTQQGAKQGVLENLYDFGDSDGTLLDIGGLIEAADGNFYGVLEQGSGAKRNGSIFQMTPQGAVKFIHTFNGAGDGSNPSSLIQGNDGKTLYGTTSFGGTYGRGTIFSISSGGSLKTLHAFTAAEAYEVNGIIQGSDGHLYGTARGWDANLGSVFTLKSDGTFAILHQFNKGWLPSSGLVEGKNGQFFGTTLYGGGWGSVYSITKEPGSYTNLHSFAPSEGAYIYSPLTKGADGKLYGVTSRGGVHNRGMIFSVSPDDKSWKTIYSFNPAVTGESANAGLMLGKDGHFYGLLVEGGKHNSGAIFKLGP